MSRESSCLRAHGIHRDDGRGHVDTVIEFVDPSRTPVMEALRQGSLCVSQEAEGDFWLPYFAYCPRARASAIKDAWLSLLPIIACIHMRVRMMIFSWPVRLVNLLGTNGARKAEVASDFFHLKACCVPAGFNHLKVMTSLSETRLCSCV